MTDKEQVEQQEPSERQRILKLSSRWRATDTWRMDQNEFRALMRTGEFEQPAAAPEQGGGAN
jgi:hypothetical protein